MAPRRGPEHADASTGEHVIEGQRELRVPVADQKLHPVPDIIQIEHQVARLLGDPGAGGMTGHTEEVDSAGTDLDG